MATFSTSFFNDTPLLVIDHNTFDILDVNKYATEFYGYSYEEFCGMNLYDFGEKLSISELLGEKSKDQNGTAWIQEKKDGDTVFVQFTSHIFNDKGRLKKLAAAHDISPQVKDNTNGTNSFPRIHNFKGEQALAEITWNTRWQVIHWSEEAAEMFGCTDKDIEAVDNFFMEFLLGNKFEDAKQLLQEKINHGISFFSLTGTAKTHSGDIKVCKWHNSLMYDENGRVKQIYSLVQDVTERKESEYLFEALSEESLVGVYLIQDNVMKYVNPRFAEILGYSKKEIENKLGPLDVVHPDDRDEVAANLSKRLNGEFKSIQYNFRCVTPKGKIVHVKAYGTRILYLGRPAIVGSLLNITHTKLALERYEASIESFEDLLDSISDAIYIQDKSGKFIKVNDAAVKLNGYDREFLLGNTPDVLAAPGKVDLKKTRRYFKKALNGERQHFEQWGRRKSGEIFPEEVILNPATYFGDDVVIAISRDISDRYEAEDQMRRSQEKFHQLFQTAPIGLVMMNEHQEIQTINQAFEQIFGYKEHEVKGFNIDKLIIPEGEKEEAKKLTNKNFEGKASSLSGRRKKKDGSIVEVMIYGVPVQVNGKTIAFFGLYVDISSQKRAEAKLKQSLKEKEVLLAEIHHRVKNNLAVITGLLELQQYNTDLDEAKGILRESQLRINSIALIHEKLYQNENLSEIPIDVYLNELIEVIKDSMKNTAKKVSIFIDAEPVFLTINQAIPCGLILNELITNSYKHAFGDKKSAQITITLSKMKGQFQINYQDDGSGLPDDIDYESPKSLGLTLIRTLSRQIESEYNFKNVQEGMEFQLQFAMDREEKSG